MTDSVPQLEPTQAVKQALNRIQEMNGRSRRSEFWWTMLAASLVYVFFRMFGFVIKVPAVYEIILLFLIIAVASLMIRRMNDTGRSPMLVFIFLGASVVNQILAIVASFLAKTSEKGIDLMMYYSTKTSRTFHYINSYFGLAIFLLLLVLIWFWCEDSQKGVNQYGISPKYPNATGSYPGSGPNRQIPSDPYGGQQSPYGGQQQSPYGGQQSPYGGQQQSPYGGQLQSPYGGQQQSPYGGQQSPYGGQQSPYGSQQPSSYEQETQIDENY